MSLGFAGRGFILLRTGFFGGGITSAVPPLAAIFSAADLEKWWALTVSFLVSFAVAEDADAVGRPLGQARLLQRVLVDRRRRRRTARRGRRR